MSDHGSLWTVDDVAVRLGMGRDWVYAETRAKRIPHVKLGRTYRYRPEAIEAWLSDIESGDFPATNGARARPQ